MVKIVLTFCLLFFCFAKVIAQVRFNFDARDAMNTGPCKKLLGDIRVSHVFIDDINNKMFLDKKNILSDISNSFLWLDSVAESNSIALNINSNIERNICIDVNEISENWLDSIYSLVQNEYNNKCAVIFHVAGSSKKASGKTIRDSQGLKEYSIIYHLGQVSFKSTLIHEFLHLFGAMDLYYPKSKTQGLLEAKIMNDISHKEIMQFQMDLEDCELSIITKYLIGWVDQIDDSYIEFFNEEG